MAGEARIPVGSRLRDNVLPGNELRHLAPFSHRASIVRRRGDDRDRAAEPYHYDWPADLNDNRLATEERSGAATAVRTDPVERFR